MIPEPLPPIRAEADATAADRAPALADASAPALDGVAGPDGSHGLDASPGPVPTLEADLEPEADLELEPEPVLPRAARTAPVRPTPPGSHWRGSISTPAFWMLVALLAIGTWRVATILRPAVDRYPVATTVAIVLFALYAIPFVVAVSSLDYLEREPWPLLFTAGAWGGLVAMSVAIPANLATQQLLAKLVSPTLAATWGPALTGPTVEEPLKMLGVVVIWLIAREHMNSVVDGVVYGAFVGLGFQVVEDIMYALNAVEVAGRGDRATPVVVTFLLRGFLGGVWSHTLFSALAGAGVAFVALRSDRPLWTFRVEVGAIALLAAWGFHFLWNSPWLADGFGYGALGVVLALFIKGIPAVLLFVWLVRNASQREAAYYIRELTELGDPRIATPRELVALCAGRTRVSARRFAYLRRGRACARSVRRLQRTQALLAVELSRGGDRTERYRADLLVERAKLIGWGHPDAYAPSGGGIPWYLWAGMAVGAGLLAGLFAAIVRALGGA